MGETRWENQDMRERKPKMPPGPLFYIWPEFSWIRGGECEKIVPLSFPKWKLWEGKNMSGPILVSEGEKDFLGCRIKSVPPFNLVSRDWARFNSTVKKDPLTKVFFSCLALQRLWQWLTVRAMGEETGHSMSYTHKLRIFSDRQGI